MLYKAVHSKLTRLVFYSAISAEHALKLFRVGLKRPEEWVDLKMVPLTLEDVEVELKAAHERALEQPAESWSDGKVPAADDIFGGIEYNPSI